MPTPYDTSNPDPEASRRIFLDWLRVHPTGQLDKQGAGYEPHVEHVGQSDPAVLAFHMTEVFWELLVEGVVAPGTDSCNLDLPWYHVTKYGQKVLATGAGHPHDEEAYLVRVATLVATPDATVMAYLTESVRAFRRATPVAAAVMLGIAAERVFLILCEALLGALKDSAEQKAFGSLLDRFPMKPKLDWMHNKVQEVHAKKMAGWPDNATLAVTAIYDFLRAQRNDLGHPRDAPPAVDRDEVFGNLHIFPRFYQTADALAQFFEANKV